MVCSTAVAEIQTVLIDLKSRHVIKLSNKFSVATVRKAVHIILEFAGRFFWNLYAKFGVAGSKLRSHKRHVKGKRLEN